MLRNQPKRLHRDLIRQIHYQLICLAATITEEGYLQLVLLENKEDNKIERQVTFSLKDNGWWIESVEIVSDDK